MKCKMDMDMVSGKIKHLVNPLIYDTHRNCDHELWVITERIRYKRPD